MMPICTVETFQLGRYTVRRQPRPDNPYWPCYVVMLRDKIIGHSFSIPDIGCCDWLKRNYDEGRTIYADRSAPLYSESIYRRGKSGRRGTFTINRRGRPTKEEQRRREAELLAIIENPEAETA